MKLYKSIKTGKVISEPVYKHLNKDENKINYKEMTNEEMEQYYKQMKLLEEETKMSFTNVDDVSSKILDLLIKENIDYDSYQAILATLDYKIKVMFGPLVNNSLDRNHLYSLVPQVNFAKSKYNNGGIVNNYKTTEFEQYNFVSDKDE